MIDARLLEARDVLARAEGEPTADRLYERWYHAHADGERVYPAASAYLAATLDARRFEGGWRVVAQSDEAIGAVLAEREGERRILTPPGFAPTAAGAPWPRTGDAVLADPSSTAYAGGFWHLWTGAWRRCAPPAKQRLYFATSPGQELRLAEALVRGLPTDGCWACKMLCGPHGAGRRDAAVAYFAKDLPLHRALPAALAEAEGLLTAGALPPLVREVAPGIGWAPELAADRSFGQVICARLATLAEDASILNEPAAWLAAARACLGDVLESGPA